MDYSIQKLWERDATYVKRRIPGMIVLFNGTVLCYHEARVFDSDRALTDIYVQRTTDGGKSFEEPILIAKSDPDNATMGSPSMVVDQLNVLHMLYLVPSDYNDKGGMLYHRRSHDGGKTWSSPVNILGSLAPDYYDLIVPCPGHGLCAPDGKLIFAAYLFPKYLKDANAGGIGSVLSTIYSTDNGKTWALGEIITHQDPTLSPNECMVATLSDGRIILDARTEKHCRAQSVSANGISNWSPLTLRHDLIDPNCFGSIISYKAPDKPYTLFLANCCDTEDRVNVCIKYSLDDGKTWSKGKNISGDLPAGYVDIAADPKNGLVYALFEESGGYSVHFVKMTYEFLTSD